jgi:O-antigen/teichoic acid export membrane protein
VINFVTLGLLARVLNPNSLGYYNAIHNSGNSINMMSSLGAPLVIQRTGALKTELDENIVSRVFSTCFTLYMIINIIAALTLVIFPQYFFRLLLDKNGEIQYVHYISVIVVLNAANQIPLYLMLGLGEFKKYSVINLVNSISILIITFIIILITPNKLEAVIWGLILASMFNIGVLGFLFYPLLRKHRLFLKFSLNSKILRDVLSSGFLYYFGNTFLVAVISLVTISLFYRYLTSFDYGFMRIGNAFAILFSLIPTAMQPVTISMLATRDDRHRYVKSIQFRIIPFFSVLLFILLSFNLEVIIPLLFGKNYLGAINIVLGMILLQILNIYLGLINTFQIGSGNMNYIGVVASITCIFLLGSYFYMVPRYGILGYFLSLYTATLISLGAMAIKEFYKTQQLNRQDYISIILIGGLLLFSLFTVIYMPFFVRIFLSVILIGLAFILFWKYCLTAHERLMVVLEYSKRRSQILKYYS